MQALRRRAGDFNVYDDARQLANALADAIVDCARDAIAARGAFFVALAGGTTPKAAYALLAEEPRNGEVDWKNVFAYFSDERCVPPEDERSNYRSARDTLLAKVPIPGANVRRMRGEDPPAQAAKAYAQQLRDACGELPRLDLVLLGMGPDGHTASLFPGSDPLTDDAALVRAPFVEQAQMYRLTVTPRVINAARSVAIATEGPAKAEVLARVREGAYDPCTLPIQIVAPTGGRLLWLVDRAAASKLHDEP